MKSVFTCFAFSAVMIQVNHSVHDEYLGAVNGLGQSLAALARAIGPALGGAMWSISTKHHFVWLNFIVICCSFMVCLYLNQLLPASLDFKKKARKGQRAGDADGMSGEGGAPMMH
jgi:MFS family permease